MPDPAPIESDSDGCKRLSVQPAQADPACRQHHRGGQQLEGGFAKLGPGGTGELTISGGLATYPWDGATREALLKQADQALLAAKRAGKNRIFLIGDAQKQEPA